jgi:Outer membrane protein beta-barrel domain
MHFDGGRAGGMKKVFLLSAVLTLFWSAPATAGKGTYLGAGLAYDRPWSSDVGSFSPGTGLDLKAGHKFGFASVEGDWVSSPHNDNTPGFGKADFYSLSLDLRFFLTREKSRNQVYLLAGFGVYSMDEFDPGLGEHRTLRGRGFNLGFGVEHYLNELVSLNLGLKYRIIRYNQLQTGSTTSSLDPEIHGDSLNADFCIFYHF